MDTADEFIARQNEKEQAILLALHGFILTYEGLRYKSNYDIPFYYGNSWVCYLNVLKKGGVELVFVRANELPGAADMLNFRGRKQVAGIEFHDAENISWEMLDQVFQLAIQLDATQKYSLKKKK